MTCKKHQIKSSRYYLFWGIMAASVVAGQIYVGTGYREMNETLKEFMNYSLLKDKRQPFLLLTHKP